MRYIKNFTNFLIILEALKDEIPLHYTDIIKQRHGDEILKKDIPKHTVKIPNLKIEITDEKFLKPIKDNLRRGLNNNIRNEYYDSDFHENIYPHIPIYHNGELLIVNDLKSIEKLCSRDINLPDMKSVESGNGYQISKNKSSIVKFLSYYNKLKGTNYSIEGDKKLKGIMTFFGEYNSIDGALDDANIYLYITDKAYDKLNMSLSKYYTSCQNIYSGDMNDKLLANVFDPNTKVAYIISDTPFHDERGNKIDYSPLSRCLIRYDEGSDKIMFDKVYPTNDFLKMYKIIEHYTDLRHSKNVFYSYKVKEDLPRAYMDTFISASDIELSNADIKNIISQEYEESSIEVISKYEIRINGDEYSLLSEKDIYEEELNSIRDFFGEKVISDKEEFCNMLMDHVILCRDILKFLESDSDKLEEIADQVDNNPNDINYTDECMEFIEILEDEYDLEYEFGTDFFDNFFDFQKYVQFKKTYHDYDMIDDYQGGERIEYKGSSYWLVN